MELGKNKTKKNGRLVTVGHHSMACKLYAQIRDCLMGEIFGKISLLIVSRQLLVFFHVLCKTSNTEIQLYYSYVSVKAVLKTFANFIKVQLYPTGTF